MEHALISLHFRFCVRPPVLSAEHKSSTYDSLNPRFTRVDDPNYSPKGKYAPSVPQRCDGILAWPQLLL